MLSIRTILRKYNIANRYVGIPPFRIFDVAQETFYYLDYEGILVFMNRIENPNAYGRYVVGLANRPSQGGYFYDCSGYYNHKVPMKNKVEMCRIFNINILIYEAFKYILPYKKQAKYGYRLFDGFEFARP